MDEIKVQIGEDVLLDIGIHSDSYISSVGYDGESVDVALRRKAGRNKEWWLADTPQTDERQELEAYRKCIQSRSFWDAKHCDDCPFNPREDKDEPQTDCVKVGKWHSFTDYIVEMQGDSKPMEFRIVPQTEGAGND